MTQSVTEDTAPGPDPQRLIILDDLCHLDSPLGPMIEAMRAFADDPLNEFAVKASAPRNDDLYARIVEHAGEY